MSDLSFSFDGKNGETLRVDAQLSPYFPEQCVFTVSQPLYPDRAAHFASRDQSKNSPLVDGLFDLDFVNDVLVADNTLTVNSKSGTWQDNAPSIAALIERVLSSDAAPVSDEVTRSQIPTKDLRAKVQRILDEMINPAIASHGGSVALLDVAKNSIFLEFAGGCHGCGMARVTLKYGVERAIRENIPGVGEILDTTDHASGRNPYYSQQ